VVQTLSGQVSRSWYGLCEVGGVPRFSQITHCVEHLIKKYGNY